MPKSSRQNKSPSSEFKVPDDDGSLTESADEKTKSAAKTFFPGAKPGQVLHLKLFRFLNYGTDDKIHAASLVLSLCLILLAFIAVVASMIVNVFGMVYGTSYFIWSEWLVAILEFIRNPLLVTVSVAVGTASRSGRTE